MRMQHGFDTTASAKRHLLVGIIVSLGSLTAAAAPTAAAQRAVGPVVCAAQSTAAGLDVHCPSATVAQLLSALQQATGLRSEYPQELAPARVSVTLRRSSLVEVLENALSAFNFAVWMDQSSPSVTWVKILDMRHSVEHTDQPRAHPQTSSPSAAVAPGLTASEPVPSLTTSEAAPSFTASEAALPVSPRQTRLPVRLLRLLHRIARRRWRRFERASPAASRQPMSSSQSLSSRRLSSCLAWARYLRHFLRHFGRSILRRATLAGRPHARPRRSIRDTPCRYARPAPGTSPFRAQRFWRPGPGDNRMRHN